MVAEAAAVVMLAAGRAHATLPLHRPEGVVRRLALIVPHGARVRAEGRIPGVAGVGITTSPSTCRSRGALDVCTQGVEACPLPPARWRFVVSKRAGPPMRVVLQFVVGGLPPVRPTVSDGFLRVRLPLGWFGSAAPGTQVVNGRERRVAWMAIGDFPFPDLGTRQGIPHVPPRRVLISIGDFAPAAASPRWPHVDRLGVGDAHVLFHGRAISVSVAYGSRPTARLRVRANRLLEAIRG